MATVASARIGPTALYTGHVWQRHGLAPAALATRSGQLLFDAVEPLVRLSSLGTGGATIESFLVARHRLIDALLERRIEAGEVEQVLEIAAGLSGRGHRFVQRYGARGLVYVEGDLAAMASRKSRAFERAELCQAGHHVVELDALADEGPVSLAVVAARRLEPHRGTAVVCEGLGSYLNHGTLGSFWRRVAGWLDGFPAGSFITDLYLANEATTAPVARLFRDALSLFARTRVHLHFSREDEVAAFCFACGFGKGTVHWPPEQARAHVAVLETVSRRHEPTRTRPTTPLT